MDWSSDVCSSDLRRDAGGGRGGAEGTVRRGDGTGADGAVQRLGRRYPRRAAADHGAGPGAPAGRDGGGRGGGWGPGGMESLVANLPAAASPLDGRRLLVVKTGSALLVADDSGHLRPALLAALMADLPSP